MRLRTVLTSAAAAVMLLAPTSTAQAVAPPDRSATTAQDAVAAATGLDTELLAGRSGLAAGTVAPASGADGTDLPTLLHDRGADGYSLVAVLDHGRSQADFELDLPDGAELRPAGDGALWVVDVASERTVGAVEAPWALDARGSSCRPATRCCRTAGCASTSTPTARCSRWPPTRASPTGSTAASRSRTCSGAAQTR